jgi:branched-chain amino acid transport system permease protein
MDVQIAAILAMDGVATGAIYALIALGFVLIFAVTRVIFVPFGDLVAFTALTLSSLENGRLPGTVGMVVALAALATFLELTAKLQARDPHRIPRAIVFFLILPLLPAIAVWLLASSKLGMVERVVLALAIITPVAPLLDRIVFKPIADASVLLLLTVSLALHFALVGLGLLFFGPEGVRTEPLTDAIFDLGGVAVSAQMLLIVVAAAVFTGLLYVFREFTMIGKALRATAVNRTGARLVGIRPAVTGTVAYFLASLLAGISGVLIAPVTTIFYDSGFLIGLKAFVGAIIGAMDSYPMTAAGAIFVGLLESYASFWNSAFKEVVVFSILIPVLLWRSVSVASDDEEVAEE